MRHAGSGRRARRVKPPTTVFLDRDGVINRHRQDDYVKSWSEFEFLPLAKDALRLLAEREYRVLVVTNQRGVARGCLTEADLAAIHALMIDEASQEGGEIEAVYYCPHEIGLCGCRKPATGLFLEAQREYPDVEFTRSIVIGDSLSDMEAGTRLGCRNIFVGQSEQFASALTLYDAVSRFLVNRPGA
jgi:D-glycero-D-manno-heptose 1,7-bisphosphate phosphatase